MRRKDREMPKAFALEVLDKCKYATLATINDDGTPYCLPISIVCDKDYVYFHCAHEGQKIENIKSNSNVCLSCVGEVKDVIGKFTIEFESAVLTGTAEEVLDKEEAIHALKILCEHHTPHNMENFDAAIEKSLYRTAVWKITIEEISGKRKKYDKQGIEMKFGRVE